MTRPYRNAGTAASLAIVTLAIGAAMDASAMRFLAGPHPPGAMIPPDLFLPLHAFVRLLTVIFFIVWLDVLYRNVPSAGAATEHNPIWATIGPLLPPFCFFRPPQLVDEAWRGSTPEDQQESSYLLAYVWWLLLWIPPPLFVFAVVRNRILEPDAKTRLAKMMFTTNVLAAVAGIVVIWAVTQRQRVAAEAIRRAQKAAIAATAAAAARARAAARAAAAAPVATEPIAETATAVPRPKAARPPVPRPANFRVAPPPPTAQSEWERAIESVSSSVWVAVVTWSTFAAGIAMLINAAVLLATRSDQTARILASIYVLFAIVFVAAALLLRGHRAPRAERWRGLAAGAVVLAIINILSLTEIFPRW